MCLIKKVFLTILLCVGLIGHCQDKITLSGVITDLNNNETLIGVNVIFPELNIGTTTNGYGFYSITLPKGSHRVLVSYIGYQDIDQQISLNESSKKNFELTSSTEILQEVVVQKDLEKLNVKTPQMSVNNLSIATIKKIPAVLGETDVIKSLLLLPGVSNAGEASSGFNVRGGATDQNLILLDEATIFNSDHLFGFFSVFNPEAIKNVKLYKGGIPARYGGRVSSVLDIYQKEGNSNNFNLTGGIGVLSTRLLAEGPIVKDKSSFLIGGRSSYAHLFLKFSENDNTAFFYDLNTKLNFKINDKNSIYLSGYFGRDVFNIDQSFKNSYGNSVANLRWNHLFSDKLFSNLSLIYSDYYYGLTLDFVGFKWNSNIQNFNVKYDLKHYLSNNLELQYGVQNIYYKFNPGEIIPQNEFSGVNYLKLIDKYANETAAYIHVDQKISDRINIAYGLRFSSFNRLGQKEYYIYEDDMPVLFNQALGIYEKAPAIDTISSSKKESLTRFNNLEPRFAISYLIDSSQSIKASYNRMSQYLHLISNTSSPTPLDVWAPSGPYIKPQILDQYAIGYFKNFKQNYSIELEVYYKYIKNRVNYIDGADLIANQAIEQVILNGKSQAYGLEFLLRKDSGNLQGWLSYTLSRSEQKTPGRTPDEPGINHGQWYKTPYDKTHDISLTTSYSLSENWSLGGNFIFQTGRPTTYPVGQYHYEGSTFPYFGPRNKDRLPFYHRLDLAATYTPKSKKKKGWQGSLVYIIYTIVRTQLR